PLAFIFGAGLFFILLQQLDLPNAAIRFWAGAIFCVLMCLPFIFGLLPPHPSPFVYPPYYPPYIQEKAGFLKDGDLMMTDIPWAEGWYGGTANIWLPLKYKNSPTTRLRNDFYEINDFRRSIRALYLSARTLKNVEVKALWDYVREENKEEDWEHFVLGIYIKKEVPTGFPLKRAPEGLWPEIFLTDSERALQKTIKPSE
ncbi:MAG TPA: hypothetical protein VGE41_13265, partial [Verrucomicrobiae bacterium]